MLSSFKTNREILSNGLQLPSTFSFSGYKQALEMAPILKFFVNSLIVSFASTALNVFILAMAGYVFAKKKFRFKNLIFGILSLSMVCLLYTSRQDEMMCDLEDGVIDYEAYRDLLDRLNFSGVGIIEQDCPHATTDEAFAMAKRNLEYLQRIRLIPQE